MLKKLLQVGIIICCIAQLAYAQSNILTINAQPATHYTRVKLTFDNNTAYKIFTLMNPNRLVLDLNDVHLSVNVKNIGLSNTGISTIRVGYPDRNRLRLVFDTENKSLYKSYYDSNKATLIIDIYPHDISSAADISKQLANKLSTAFASIVADNAAKAVQVKKPERRLLESLKLRRTIVVIDAGHGGHDTGAIGPRGTQEKDVVLKIALRLADLINQQPNMRAVLTRKIDKFVPLRNRLNIARRYKGDIFIAIHADSYFSNASMGASVYALSRHGATTEAARWLASRENYSELGGVSFSDLGDKSYMLRSVLIDLAQTATINDSVKLGNYVLSSLENITKLHYQRVEQAPFMVLKSPDIPSILIETGFISNPIEEQRLLRNEYRDKLAHAILNGLNRYLITHPFVIGMTEPTKKIL